MVKKLCWKTLFYVYLTNSLVSKFRSFSALSHSVPWFSTPETVVLSWTVTLLTIVCLGVLWVALEWWSLTVPHWLSEIRAPVLTKALPSSPWDVLWPVSVAIPFVLLSFFCFSYTPSNLACSFSAAGQPHSFAICSTINLSLRVLSADLSSSRVFAIPAATPSPGGFVAAIFANPKIASWFFIIRGLTSSSCWN